MNHTKNYHLPQWNEDDLILMKDFNDAMNGIEAGIDGAKAEAQARDTELDRKITAANIKADAAQTAAALKPYATGTYTGTGGDTTINLGFRPSFVIICGMLETSGSEGFREYIHYSGMSAGNILQHRMTFTDTGFIARGASYAGYGWPYLTAPGRVYDYIAYK